MQPALWAPGVACSANGRPPNGVVAPPPSRSTLVLALALVVLVGGPLLFLAEPSVIIRRTDFVTSLWPKQQDVSAAAVAAVAAAEAAAARGRTLLHICVRDGGYYEGEWIHRPHAPRPHAHYASKLKGKHQFVDAEIAFRKLHPFDLSSGRGEYLKHNQYDWEPHAPECRLSPFNRTRACLALSKATGAEHGKGRVLFVGDSMSFAHALSLMMMLGPDGNEGQWVPKQTAWREASVCGDVLGGDDKAVLIHFIRNDALYVAKEKLEAWAGQRELATLPRGGVDFEDSLPWTPYFEEHLPGLVVLNMGLHIHGLEPFQVLLDDTLGYLQRHRDQFQQDSSSSSSSSRKPPYPRLLFRTTGPGHPECWRYSAPASEAEARTLSHFEGQYRDKFTWHLIPEFNRYLERRVQETFPTTEDDDAVLLLRAEGITRRRPDGHLVGALKDCLHYHLPGPLDAWTLTLLETLYTVHDV